MKFSATVTLQYPTVFSAFSVEDWVKGLDWMRDSGLDGAELCISHYNGLDIGRVKALLDERGLGCSTLSTGQARGLEGPFVHDLCAFGFVCRLAVQALFPGRPERLKRMYAAMKTVLYPDTPLALELWELEEGKAAFRLRNDATGKAVLDRGEIEWA